MLKRFSGCLLGLAVGDAVGTTVEFRERGKFPPVTDMVGGGPFALRPGAWTDDTSMALCPAESLIAMNGSDGCDQMERYWKWYQDGYMSSTGVCFDIGNTVRKALHKYKETGNPMSGVTDGLIKLAKEIMPLPSEREMDMLLATGEQTTIAGIGILMMIAI
jgi:ADP-ribosyl-[dinitrogen reductase] hydrolase